MISGSGNLLEWLGFGALLVGCVVVMFIFARRRTRHELASVAALELAHKEGRHLPATLHPKINPERCIGSLACLSVCPEGDILGVIDGKAALVNPSACIGHGMCAVECPVNAISLVFGTSERGVDLPEVSEFFQSSRKGVYVIGELGGMGLIKNAINQGLQVSEHLHGVLKGQPQQQGLVDVAIVGAGCAGLAAALNLKQKGVSFRVLEQDSIGGTIAHYPRQKVVMTTQVELPFVGRFGSNLISKEDLLTGWQRALKKANVSVETGQKVLRIDGDDGNFEVVTEKQKVRARKVVLAIGRRGTPRALEVPGDNLPKVTYRLTDASQYEGCRVLVVGGGDAALEAAIQLVDETDAEVSLSYRQANFGKAREANKRRFAELVEQGRLFAFMGSTVKQVVNKQVLVDQSGKAVQLPNDYVIACLGGELPTAFLKNNAIEMKRLHGEELSPSAPRRGSALADAEHKAQRRLNRVLFVVGALIVATLFVVGQDYYRLPLNERSHHPGHAFLKPAGVWGHGVGIVATLFMMSNFLYAARKRLELLKGKGSIRRWLTWHQFIGFMSPLVIAFHAAFRSNNTIATMTSLSLAIVVLTGVIGRYIYQLVPSRDGKALRRSELLATWERLKTRAQDAMTQVTDHMGVEKILERALVPVDAPSLAAFVARIPKERARDEADLRRIKRYFPDKPSYREFKTAFTTMRKVSLQVGFYENLRRLMSIWRVFHVVLAALLVIMISAHIGVSLYLGYRWIFK